MYYHVHRQHGQQHASSGATFVSGDINGECLLDATETPAPVRPVGETEQVMDRLLRECLKRKPLG